VAKTAEVNKEGNVWLYCLTRISGKLPNLQLPLQKLNQRCSYQCHARAKVVVVVVVVHKRKHHIFSKFWHVYNSSGQPHSGSLHQS
jgi:hypothetical protein